MAIRPINLPAGAGLNYSGGDARHFSLGDAVNVPGLSNPTRNLAERDNLLAEKMNEIVAVVNNQEQFVPLPVIRTNVPPNEEVVVFNYRIPAGFEARVLNTVISTLPSSTSAQVDIYYSNAYGGSTGTAVTTATPGSEFTGDINFYQEGEFVVVLKNTGSSTLEIAASVLLTMRPVGAEGTLLVGSIIEGPSGPPGMRGPQGLQGSPGASGAGSPGMAWQGAWINGATYQPNDVVSFNYNGTHGSWICRVANVASAAVNDPEVDPITWNYVAYGYTGAPGPTGGAGPAGAVTEMQGAVSFVDVTYVPQGGYVSAYYASGLYVYNGAAAATNYVSIQETFYGSTGGTPGNASGLASLNGMFFVAFSGEVLIILPKLADGAAVDYNNTSISCVAVDNGSNWYMATGSGAFTTGVEIRKSGVDSFYVKTVEAATIPVTLHVTGVQQVFFV